MWKRPSSFAAVGHGGAGWLGIDDRPRLPWTSPAGPSVPKRASGPKIPTFRALDRCVIVYFAAGSVKTGGVGCNVAMF